MITIIFTILSAFFYRVGGSSKESMQKYFPWYPKWAIHTWVRELVCTTLTITWLYFFYLPAAWWAYILSYILVWAATTTYWDRLPFLKGEDSYFFHGLGIGLAILPIVLTCHGNYVYFALRAVVMGLFMWIWCLIVKGDKADIWHEFGRGAILQASLPML